MSIKFFRSDAVKVYPCSYRGSDGGAQINPKARMVTEEGLVGLGGAGSLKSSYLLSFDSNVADCVIAGYRFKIDCSEYSGDLADQRLCVCVGENTNTDGDAAGKEKLARLQCMKEGQDALDASDGTTHRFYGLCLCSEAEVGDGWTALAAFDSEGGANAAALLPKLYENGAVKGVGSGNAAIGAFSLASGENAVANGEHSAAIGLNVATKDGIDGQVVVGKNGVETNAQFAVADGGAKKHNSFETGGTDGTTKINERLVVEGEAILEDDMKIAKNLFIGENGENYNVAIDKDGNANFAGRLSADMANIAGKTELASVATFETDAIKFSADTQVSEKLTAEGLEATNEIKTKALTVTDELTAKSIATTNACAVGKNLTVGGTLTSDEETKLVKRDGNSYVIEATKDKIHLNADVDASKETIDADKVTANDITAENNATLPGAAFKTSAIDLTAPVGVSENLTVAEGKTLAADALTVKYLSSRVSGEAISVDSDVSVSGKLTATGLAIGESSINEDTVNKLNAIENQLKTKQLWATEAAYAAKLVVTGEEDGAVTIGNANYIETASGNTLLKVYGKVEANRFNARSDARLKENLREYEPKKSILDLPVYEYDYKSGEKDVVGCIAQDLQEICPEIVCEGKDGYLSIEESKIVYLLLKEVKKLREEVDELKRR